ncbi:MAG: hypothetical protein GF315_13180 [candidate division Zixibacteria bacterium]|nr:hypothetical protein [candidate division Zixibacteria bacterium]
MKIIHISDSHLGVSGNFRKLTEQGYDQREEDFLHVFDIAIDRMIEMKPDVIIHSGDLFHLVRPSNRIIARAARTLLKLSDAMIPTIVISGNHDTPKTRSTGSVFQIMEIIPNIDFVYKGSYERYKYGDAIVHAIPHCLSQEDLEKQIEKAEPDTGARYNVLVVHGVVASIPEFSMNEFAEQFIPDSVFPKYDYVALGHYHGFTKIADNCYYAGSTERASFNEADQRKGFLEVDLSSNRVGFHELPARRMFKLPPIDARDFDSDKLRETIRDNLQTAELKDSIARLEIVNLPSHLKSEISEREFEDMTKSAFKFDIKKEKSEDELAIAERIQTIGKLESELERFLNNMVVEGADKQELLKLGIDYLSKARKED